MCKGFTAGVAVGMAAGAAVTVLCMPKKKRVPGMSARAARILRSMGSVAENVGDLFR